MNCVALPFLKGCFTAAGLIVAIGSQNAFVLKQGLMRNQVFVTALFCALVDAFLISLGVGGLGKVFSSSTLLLFLTKWGGAAFLFWYGFRSFRSVFRSQNLEAEHPDGPLCPSFKETLLILCALSFLNPHVYLDTVVLLGSIGANFSPDQRIFFALGAILATSLWFFGMCYGARFLAPLFKSPKAWRVLDFAIGCIMWAIALSLLLP